MFFRIASVMSVLLLACAIQAEEYRGKIVKVEKDTLLVNVSSKGTVSRRRGLGTSRRQIGHTHPGSEVRCDFRFAILGSLRGSCSQAGGEKF